MTGNQVKTDAPQSTRMEILLNGLDTALSEYANSLERVRRHKQKLSNEPEQDTAKTERKQEIPVYGALDVMEKYIDTLQNQNASLFELINRLEQLV